MRDFNPVILKPYAGHAFFRKQADGLAIRFTSHCGQVLGATASPDYINDLTGEDLAQADEDTLQCIVCVILQDETLQYRTVK